MHASYANGSLIVRGSQKTASTQQLFRQKTEPKQNQTDARPLTTNAKLAQENHSQMGNWTALAVPTLLFLALSVIGLLEGVLDLYQLRSNALHHLLLHGRQQWLYFALTLVGQHFQCLQVGKTCKRMMRAWDFCVHAFICLMSANLQSQSPARVLSTLNGKEEVWKLVFYAQSTGTVISGRWMEKKEETKRRKKNL